MNDVSARSAVVVGGGMAGLIAAAAISEHFDRVTILERDRIADETAVRPGAPQGAHVHTLLAYGAQLIDGFLPGFLEDLYAAGAVKMRRSLDFWLHDFCGPTPRRDVGIETPSMTRPLLEAVTRRKVLALSNVVWRGGVDARIEIEGASARVLLDGGAGAVHAGFVVDARGRNSPLPKALAKAGYGAIPTQELKIAMSYTSGLYHTPDDLRAPPFACLMLPKPPCRRAVYLTAVEDGLSIVSAFGRGADVCPKDDKGFHDWMTDVSHPIVHEILQRAKPAGGKKVYRLPSSRLRRFEEMRAFPGNLAPIGEAFVSLNPMYGQGMTLSAHQALSLKQALASRAANADGFGGVSADYFDACAEVNQIGWAVAETRDLTFETTTGARPTDIERKWALQEGLSRLAHEDPEVQRLITRVTHYLEHPSALQAPDLVRRALAANR